jgi:hypothetical protein
MIEPERLAAPSEHMAVLIEPNPEEIRRALSEESTSGFDAVAILDTPLAELRARLRHRLRLQTPVIVTGHQVEFFHAGVFAKTIAAGALARSAGGQAVFLLVDSDVPKTRHVAAPQVRPEGLRRALLNIPACDLQLPVECQPAADKQEWRELFDGLAASAATHGPTLLSDFAQAWTAGDRPTFDLRDAFSRALSAVEDVLGLGDVRHLRISQVCQTPEFRAFAAHLLLNAGAFRERYNEAQAAYRRAHHERNPNRPVPPLALVGERIETPLWIFRPAQARSRLYVADRGAELEFFADDESIGRAAKADLQHVEHHAEPGALERDGWRVRPRALALSAFARLFLADLFIHGIGGARYDEMTETFVLSFFNVQPPPICCVTATLHLPLDTQGVSEIELRSARRRQRELRYNPQRVVSDVPDDWTPRREALIHESRALRAERPRDRAGRRRIFNQIRGLNAELLRHDPTAAGKLADRVRTLERRRRADRIAHDREYFFALHPRAALEALAARIKTLLERR